MIPIRFVFRSRWAALLWAAGICLTAVQFAGGDANVAGNAANSSDGNSSQTAISVSDLLN